MKRFNYLSSFRSGLNAYDKAYMYTTIEALQTLLPKESNIYDGIHILSDDAFGDIEKLKVTLKDDGVGIVGWWQQNGNFCSYENGKNSPIYSFNANNSCSFLNIISSLLMTVMSRRKEIALLLSMGASSKRDKINF